ncbi:hypothetical protein BJ170DRAFT_380960 [Xylariales sp. AK1849]|nr:hypothetical protein BJ170DRAFT_380960 [Xylariales sp. AK1849]
MGLIGKIVDVGHGTGFGISYGFGYLQSSATLITPLQKSDPLWRSPLLLRLDRYDDPVLTGVCTTRIPLQNIRPELRDDEAASATELCRAVWSGWVGFNGQETFPGISTHTIAHSPQRITLTLRHQGPETANQAFCKAKLAIHAYPLGAQFFRQLRGG